MSRKESKHAAQPTLAGAILFRAKATALQTRRLALDILDNDLKRHSRSNNLSRAPVVGQSITPLRTGAINGDAALEDGKIQNLRVAIRRLNGVEVPGESVFSFWTQVGFPGRIRGFVRGRELREGCLIPNIGGGLCQLSNALYDAALSAGFEIIERHRHSQVIPGSLAEIDRDATVFWNYVDLRFASRFPFRIEAGMKGNELILNFRGSGSQSHSQGTGKTLRRLPNALNSCASCGVRTCFRHEDSAPHPGSTAYLVDERWPEFDEYIQSHRSEGDCLFIPMDGSQYRKPAYAWSTSGFSRVEQERILTVKRGLGMRRLAAQGPRRQRALLNYDESLAREFGRSLSYDVRHVVVMQNLLPFLWRDGYLGGRSFDVLMTRMPIKALQGVLDHAASLHPESPTLADFRADEDLSWMESEALVEARRIITPHTEVARLFGERAVLVGWHMPGLSAEAAGERVVFPASTLGRKGAYELREAARDLGIRIEVLGSELEGDGFWKGVQITRSSFNTNWLRGAAVVVLPAFVEHRPRALLKALAGNIRVIASTACGLGLHPNLIGIPAGNPTALHAALKTTLNL